MRKESVQKFDLEAAFKALNEVEVPVVKGIRPNREDLHEKFTRNRKLVTDILVEDYFDVSDSGEMEQAQEEREAEIAKAKLARIEKIVDLEAETEEDLLPSYVGKLIIQCPQCMTLFYKNEEDIERSEENPEVVNLNEPCQHCGNSSGYTLIGKVDTVGEEEASQYDAEDFEENELDLDFDEESTEETAEETTEETDEVATEEEEDLDLAPIEETEEEEVKESLSLREDWDAEVAAADKTLNDIITASGNENYDDGDGYWSGDNEWCNRFMYYSNSINNRQQVEELCNKYSTETCKFYVFEDDAEEDPVSEIGYTLVKNSLTEVTTHSSKDESLTEGVDKELEDKLKAHNDYIEYLKKMITEEEAALAKADNEFVKKAIQRRLDAFKADLEEALPEALKNEVAVEDLPTPEEADMEAAAENKDESKEKKESLTEDLDAERKLDAEKAELDVMVEATKTDVTQALDALEAELTEDAKVTEAADFNVSDADFRAMLKNPVFNEGCKKDLEEDITPVDPTPFEKAADAIEAAGSELTPEEQKLEDEELAAKEGVEEGLTEAAVATATPTDLLADDGTFAMLVYPERFTAEERKEKLLADPDFVKTLKAFATKHQMVANPEDLEDGVSAEEDMYSCTFEGIEGEDLEDTLDELISYYLDIKAGWDGEWKEDAEELDEAAPVLTAPTSRLKRNYSATELIVKELKTIEPFSGLSTRTIQRALLPYYLSNMGRENLSTQAMVDFFTEEGFAPFVLDNFFQLDLRACKELLQADPKFMKIFNDFATEHKLFPSETDVKEPGESDFDFAFKVVFDLDEDGRIQDSNIAKETLDAFGKWYVAGAFDKKLEADVWAVAEDFDEKEFNKLTESYLTEVYSNVKSFETTGCNLENSKLMIEGIITFNSGKTKSTTFIYEATKVEDKSIVLEGLNADFATEKAFVLNCKLDTANCLIVESLNYKYTINNTLVEGLLK